MKAVAKSHVEDTTREPVKVLIPSAGITAGIEVEDGKLKIKTKGRPSGQMPDGSHGDHVSAQILSAHGIRRAANGTKVAEIDDLRNVRESIFSFISSIAVLNGTRQLDADISTSSTNAEAINAHYVVNDEKAKELYARVNQILDEYNAERYKNSKLKILEKIWKTAANNEAIIAGLNLSNTETTVIWECGGLEGFLNEHMGQVLLSNNRLICDTFARLIEATSTYYYKIPNTAYHRITGYEASVSEGGNINATLSILDEICRKVVEERNPETSSGRLRRTINTLSDIAKAQAQEELNKKSGLLDNERDKQAIKARTLSFQIDKLSICTASGNNPLVYVAFKLKDLFHYPEVIGDSLSNSGRTNDINKFYDQVSRHLFIAFNVYPELVQNTRDKNNIINLFLNEVINYSTDLGEDRGWPSLRSVDMDAHVTEVITRLQELESAKEANLYQNTQEYRSRASSGAMEKIKEEILEPAMQYITKHFGLEEESLYGLKKQLEGLTLGIEEMQFRREVMKSIVKYCENLDVETSKMDELKNEILLPVMQKTVGGKL